MRAISLIAFLLILVAIADSRSVDLDLLTVLKSSKLTVDSARTIVTSLYDPAEENGGERNIRDSKLGFIIVGSLDELNKLKIGSIENKTKNKRVSNTKTNTASEVKVITNNLVLNAPKPGEEDHVVDTIAAQNEIMTNEKVNKLVFELLDDYEDDDDSESYEDNNTDSKSNNVAEFFSEDEFNYYDEEDNKDEVESSEEDESDEGEFYDEDETYFEDENNKFEFIKK